MVPSVARADCAHLQRDLFGIVVSNLPLEEARAFQAELKRRGFPTDVVADEELPVLQEPFTIQRIETGGKPWCSRTRWGGNKRGLWTTWFSWRVGF